MAAGRKLISVVMPCYNEEENVREACDRVRQQFAALPRYDYEHIFIDNASTDRTVAILKEIAAGRRIYVHCRSGIGRSPSLAIAVAAGSGDLTMVDGTVYTAGSGAVTLSGATVALGRVLTTSTIAVTASAS